MLRILNIFANHLDFHEVVLLKNHVDRLYRFIGNPFTGSHVYDMESVHQDQAVQKKFPLLLTSVPGYLKTDLDLGPDMVRKNVRTFPGSLLRLSAYHGFDDYLDKNFQHKGRSHFRKSDRLLEQCFDISHTMYFGSMADKDYKTVFDAFEQMQAIRFKQKSIPFHVDPMLPEYRERTLELVREKKACISVIYDQDRPIAVSLNYVLGKIIHGFTKTFDVAYSKFGIGSIELLRTIEWAFDEGFEIMDFMKGEYSYKSKFADTAYDFNIETIYPRNRTIPCIRGNLVFWALHLFYSTYHLSGPIRAGIKKGAKNIRSGEIGSWRITVERTAGSTNGTRLNFREITNKEIQRAICDYCYANREHMHSLRFYALEKKGGAVKMIAHEEIIIFTIR